VTCHPPPVSPPTHHQQSPAYIQNVSIFTTASAKPMPSSIVQGGHHICRQLHLPKVCTSEAHSCCLACAVYPACYPMSLTSLQLNPVLMG
jgi:hypothetical protein